jgi:16S rRNA C967 or C1407 C5-methylase (RsmB/RsmF family)
MTGKTNELTAIEQQSDLALERRAASTRDTNGRFLTGNIGGGRPKGSRNRLSDVLLSVVVDDFAEHGAEAIAQLRQKDPATYLRLVASLVPRELIVAREEAPPVDYAELTDAEVVRLLEDQRRRTFIEKALKSV